MNNWLMRADFGSAPTNYTSLIIALLLAFVCGHAIAWYENQQRRKRTARQSHWRRWLREHPYPD